MLNKNYICWYENKSLGVKAKVIDITIKNPGRIRVISEGDKIRNAAFEMNKFEDRLEVYNIMNEVAMFMEALQLEYSKYEINEENSNNMYEDIREFMAAMCKKHSKLTYEDKIKE